MKYLYYWIPDYNLGDDGKETCRGVATGTRPSYINLLAAAPSIGQGKPCPYIYAPLMKLDVMNHAPTVD